MHFLISPQKVLDTLKKCIEWKNDVTLKAAKLPLNIFIDFVKLRILPKNDSAQNAFIAFQKNTNDLKAEGKLEAWIEIGIDVGTEQIPNLEKDLKERYEKVEAFYKAILKEQKDSEAIKNQDVKEIVEEKKVEVIEEEVEIDHEESIPDIEKPIIVPWDFSDVAQFALDHAILFSQTISGQIFLLHITKSEKENEQAQAELDKIAIETFKQHKIKPHVIVHTGNIFKTITQIANDNHAKFVIMGTHGIKGMQKFTGSFALKVIAGTNTPFIVVQEPPHKTTIQNILFPVDNTKENKQKLKQARILSRYYKLKFFLTVPEKLVSEHTKHVIKTNLNFITHFFKQNQIDYEVVHVAGTDNFSEATLKFASENKPDLIIVLTTKNINFQDYVLGADEQKIIANPSKTPVMCVNPVKVNYGGVGPTSMTY
jgi:nucleotide-binding universal stress UspA family protein